jgi:Tol biopolymer transport system component
MFSPAYSPDGRKIAVQWNRRPQRGIWVIDTRDRRETLVYATGADSAMPIGWSADARSIYVIEGKGLNFRGTTAPLGETVTDARIVRVPANGGGGKTVTVLPFDEIGSADMTPDGRRVVCAVYSSRSDVWVVDNFDASP